MTASNQFNNSPILYSPKLLVSDLPASAVSKSKRSQLGDDFKPSRFSVICGRGKDSYDHVGNHHFRELASMFVARYVRAGSKADKSEIVSEMVGMIHQAEGTFCKFENGAWFQVGDHYAREKAGALLRDMVHTQQLSSSSPVVKVKQAKKAKKTKVKPTRPKIQKESKAQHQQLVDFTTGHSNDFIPAKAQVQYGQLLVEYDIISRREDSTPNQQLVDAGVWLSDNSSVSTLSYSGELSLGFDENWLDDEEDFSDIFGTESCLVGVPSSLFNAAHCY
jgi:hypothetical protein